MSTWESGLFASRKLHDCSRPRLSRLAIFVAAGALDDLARDGEPEARAGHILPPARIDVEEGLEHLAYQLGRNAGAFILDDHFRKSAGPRRPSRGRAAQGRGIDHEGAQSAGKSEPARPHADRLQIGDRHVESLVLRRGLPRTPRTPGGAALELIEIGEPQAPFSSSSTNSARRRMCMMGVRSLWPAAASRRMRPSHFGGLTTAN